MRRCWCIPLLGGFLLLCSIALGQEVSLRQVEAALQGKKGGVFDFGHLLPPDKIRELKQEVVQHQAQGLNVYFVTLPGSTPGTDVDAMAEAVYRDLQMSSKDLLITFNGKRLYGKTLALKGEPLAFQKALEEARPAFKLDIAKGLAQFARSLSERIHLRQTKEIAERQAGENRRRLIKMIILGILLLILGLIFYPRVRQYVVANRIYKERLQTAERLFDKITLKMPEDASPNLTAEYLRLDQKLNRCRKRRGTSLKEIDQLITRLKELDQQLPERADQPSILGMLEEEDQQS